MTVSIWCCDRCEGDGSYSDLAPCTTHDRDCACNGPRVLVDPCDECGGWGMTPPPRRRAGWAHRLMVWRNAREMGGWPGRAEWHFIVLGRWADM